ncbi:MAG: M28 family peptidase, partial [candidate division WOR-3 bacterium]
PLAARTRASSPCPAAVDDSLVRELVSRVSGDTVESLLVRMRQFATRYSSTDSCFRAMEWVRSRFEAWGCSTYLDTFRPGYAPNAVGIKRGTLTPDAVFVVCGHTDATSEIPFTLTPGSEDNASGTAAVMELCRATADTEFENTVWFIGFAGEEQGLVGSDSFARQAADRGDSIVLAVNFDMISYGRENKDTIVIYGARQAPGSEQWVDFFIAQADSFSDLKHRKTMEYIPQARSDHYSFWKYGFPAIRGGYSDRTPHYHSTGDTIGPLYYAQCGTNNIPMEAEVIKALVATIAKLGGAHLPVGIEQRPHRPAARLLEVRPTVGPAPLSLRLSGPLSMNSTLEVYDATGSLVRRLDCSGCSTASWDGTDRYSRQLPSGIYLFRVNVPGHSSVARAVLTR